MKHEILKNFKYLIFLLILKKGLCSVGDISPFYNKCFEHCKAKKCDTGQHSMFEYSVFGFAFSLWSCMENCEYICQWKTVDSFLNRNWSIPQFKGKWPFVRMFGFQEPASVLFSVLNFFVILKLLILFRRKVNKSAPYYYVWNGFGLVQLNSWFWSSIYHSRDKDFSERLDYISAFLVIIYSMYAMGLRYLNTSFNLKTLLWTAFCFVIGLNHSLYLWMYNIDYTYNMMLNCLIGGITVVGWFFWSYLHYRTQFFIWKIFLFALLMPITTLLELMDFPPLFWLLDAHALWHGSTIFLNILFFHFVIEDCIYLNDSRTTKARIDYKKK